MDNKKGRTILGLDAAYWRIVVNWRLWVVTLAGIAGLLLMMAEPGGDIAVWTAGFFATKGAGLALLWIALRLGEMWDKEGKLLGRDDEME